MHERPSRGREPDFKDLGARAQDSAVIRAIRRGRDKQTVTTSVARRTCTLCIVSRSPDRLSSLSNVHLSKCIRTSCYFLVASIPDACTILIDAYDALFSFGHRIAGENYSHFAVDIRQKVVSRDRARDPSVDHCEDLHKCDEEVPIAV